MRIKHAVFVVVTSAILLACANAPLPTTPTKDSPCGISYVTCTLEGKPTGGCCDENNICCNGSTCPSGMCDYTGDDDSNILGKRKHQLSSQWQAGSKR